MENYQCGKVLVTSLSVMLTVTAGAYLCYRMLRGLVSFCAVFDTPSPPPARVSYDEIEERDTGDAEKIRAADKA